MSIARKPSPAVHSRPLPRLEAFATTLALGSAAAVPLAGHLIADRHCDLQPEGDVALALARMQTQGIFTSPRDALAKPGDCPHPIHQVPLAGAAPPVTPMPPSDPNTFPPSGVTPPVPPSDPHTVPPSGVAPPVTSVPRTYRPRGGAARVTPDLDLDHHLDMRAEHRARRR